jgi:hypothetical protein
MKCYLQLFICLRLVYAYHVRQLVMGYLPPVVDDCNHAAALRWIVVWYKQLDIDNSYHTLGMRKNTGLSVNVDTMLSKTFPYSHRPDYAKNLIFRDNNCQLGSPKFCDLRMWSGSNSFILSKFPHRTLSFRLNWFWCNSLLEIPKKYIA